jgi:hypothetical protein
MSPYSVRCYQPGCTALAVYKIAARWSDGLTDELKTYALSCPACLADCFRRARARRAVCRLASGETLEEPGIYELARGRHDRELVRREDLEKQLTTEEEPGESGQDRGGR